MIISTGGYMQKTKPIQISAEIHKRLKTISSFKDMQMKDYAENALLKEIEKDEEIKK